MKRLVRFLVWKMDTLDGIRGSAKPLLELLQTRKSRLTTSQLAESQKENFLKESTWRETDTVNKYDVFREVCLKYNILMVRQKISYQAALTGQTVAELFFNAINRLLRI